VGGSVRGEGVFVLRASGISITNSLGGVTRREGDCLGDLFPLSSICIQNLKSLASVVPENHRITDRQNNNRQYHRHHHRIVYCLLRLHRRAEA